MAEQPTSGREYGRRILSALREYVARSTSLLGSQVAELRARVDATLTMEMVRGTVDAAIARLPEARQGKDGEPGKSVTLVDLQPIIETAAERAGMQAYRDAQARLDRAIENLPKPKDGNSTEDFDVAQKGRQFTIAMKIGGQVMTREFRLDVPMYQGVWRSGQAYEKADIVTYGGSGFIALEATAEKPETSKHWALFVKRGRDGKDVEP